MTASSPSHPRFSYQANLPPSFTERGISTIAKWAWRVFAADVDGDGATDVLSASYGDDMIAWYENVTLTSRCEGLEAVIQATPAQGEQPLEVAFDGSQSKTNLERCGAINQYEWKIDGDEATFAQVSRTFERFGNKPVHLRVTTDKGSRSTRVKSAISVAFRKGPVAPWTSTEIGDAAVSGGARMEGGCVVVGAGGKGVITQRGEDSFQFVHLKLTGDFSLSARIRSVELATGSPSLGGIMARASTDPGSPFTLVGIRQRDEVLQPFTRRRTRAGGQPRGTSPRDGVAWREVKPPAFYVRLDRTGDKFSFFSSTDGTNWEDLGRTGIDLPDEVLVGLFASAEDASERQGREATVEVTYCELSGFPALSRFRRGDCNDDGEVNITDGVCILNWLFLGAATPGCVAVTNTNGDDAANIADATYLLSHLFAGGPPPAAPFPDCGPGMLPADEELGCANPPDCQ